MYAKKLRNMPGIFLTAVPVVLIPVSASRVDSFREPRLKDVDTVRFRKIADQGADAFGIRKRNFSFRFLCFAVHQQIIFGQNLFEPM